MTKSFSCFLSKSMLFLPTFGRKTCVFCPNLYFFTHIWKKNISFLSKSILFYPHLDKKHHLALALYPFRIFRLFRTQSWNIHWLDHWNYLCLYLPVAVTRRVVYLAAQRSSCLHEWVLLTPNQQVRHGQQPWQCLSWLFSKIDPS